MQAFNLQASDINMDHKLILDDINASLWQKEL